MPDRRKVSEFVKQHLFQCLLQTNYLRMIGSSIESKSVLVHGTFRKNMKSKLSLLLLFLANFATSSVYAKPPPFNAGGLGCGTIVSLRESTQKPFLSEAADVYTDQRPDGTDSLITRLLSPFVGVGAALVADVAATSAMSSNAEKRMQAEKEKEAATHIYKDVMAVEFRFDDGQTINIPMIVVSGMRYKVGARLNAMESPKYGHLALGINVLFAGIPTIGDSDYDAFCRIDDPERRMAVLESVNGAVDESRIVDPKLRRVATISAPVNASTAGVSPSATLPAAGTSTAQ